jgi:hypothetical protein
MKIHKFGNLRMLPRLLKFTKICKNFRELLKILKDLKFFKNFEI